MAFTITIDQEEIETAIQNHVRSKVTIAEGQNVSIDLKAGRGENGFSATINIGDVAPTKTTSVAQADDSGAASQKAAPVERLNGKPVTKDEPQQAEPVADAAEPTKSGAKLFGGAPSGRNIDESSKSAE